MTQPTDASLRKTVPMRQQILSLLRNALKEHSLNTMKSNQHIREHASAEVSSLPQRA